MKKMVREKVDDNDNKVLFSFVAAWICVISSARQLIKKNCFTRMRFGAGTIEAIRIPDNGNLDFRHLGLFTWISKIARTELIGKEHATIRMCLNFGEGAMNDVDSENGKLDSGKNVSGSENLRHETYEMKIVCKKDKVRVRRNQDDIQRKIEGILRLLRMFCQIDSLSQCLDVSIVVDTAETGLNTSHRRSKSISTPQGEEKKPWEFGQVEIGNFSVSCRVLSSFVEK